MSDEDRTNAHVYASIETFTGEVTDVVVHEGTVTAALDFDDDVHEHEEAVKEVLNGSSLTWEIAVSSEEETNALDSPSEKKEIAVEREADNDE